MAAQEALARLGPKGFVKIHVLRGWHYAIEFSLLLPLLLSVLGLEVVELEQDGRGGDQGFAIFTEKGT